jgi:multidrug resistance efflux pump
VLVPIDPDALPSDVATLRAMLAAQSADMARQSAEMAAQRTELAAARAGLLEQRYEIEALRARLAKRHAPRAGDRATDAHPTDRIPTAHREPPTAIIDTPKMGNQPLICTTPRS